MLADSLDLPPAAGALARGVLLPGTFLSRVIDFVAEQIPGWLRHPRRPPAVSERVLSDQLCSHLNSAARDSFDFIQFSTEVPDPVKRARSLDIAAKPAGVDAVITIEGKTYTQFDVLLPIECKRLPTPTEGDRDEREYVTTSGGRTTGGIQRFKSGAHGSAHGLAAMIGFIQQGDAHQWLSRINRWLVEEAKRDDTWSGELLTPVADPTRPSIASARLTDETRVYRRSNCDTYGSWFTRATRRTHQRKANGSGRFSPYKP